MRSLVPYDRKSVSGIPQRGPARQPVDLAAQARVARGRLWPPTLVYGIGSAVVVALAVWRHGWRTCLPWVAAGFQLWTWTEYVAHRFVLHGKRDELLRSVGLDADGIARRAFDWIQATQRQFT